MKTLPDSLRVGLLQWDILTDEPERNLASFSNLLEQVVREEVQIVGIPEMWTRSFCRENLAAEGDCLTSRLEFCREQARRHRVWIAAGTLPEPASPKKVYNTFFLIDSGGEIQLSYRKIHPFPNTGEPEFFDPGKDLPKPVKSGNWVIGAGICFDLRFPEVFRLQAREGVNLFFVPSQFPCPRQDHFILLSRARALENLSYFVAINRTGKTEELTFPGHSTIIDFWGNTLVEMAANNGFQIATVEFERLRKTRKDYPFLESLPLLAGIR